jgi:hypothetical protein
LGGEDSSLEDDIPPPQDDDEEYTGNDLITQIPAGSETSLWLLPNSFEIFLNQCAIQSLFVFLLKSLRDPHTVLWLEEFTKPSIALKSRPSYANQTGGSANSKLLSYHGLAAMNTTLFPTWDSYFSQLLEQPKELYLIESDLPYVPTYELEINPASLSYMLISVREQIAREFVKDLDVIFTMGGHTLETYWEGIRKLRQETNDDSPDGATPRVLQSLLFLEFGPNEESDYSPSPLRKGNFDLLMNLATQQSIHRVLNDPDRKEGAELLTNQYLRNLYLQRLDSHFTRAQWYRRSDDFLQQLLSQSPSMVQSSEDTTSLIDPTRLAELILREHEKVALEWKDIAANVPEAHLKIKRLQLNLLMRISNTPVKGELD